MSPENGIGVGFTHHTIFRVLSSQGKVKVVKITS
jgi:hypothetical protein